MANQPPPSLEKDMSFLSNIRDTLERHNKEMNLDIKRELEQLSLEINKRPLTLAPPSNNMDISDQSQSRLEQRISSILSECSANMNRIQRMQRDIDIFNIANRAPVSSKVELKRQSLEINKRPLTLASPSAEMDLNENSHLEIDQPITSTLHQSSTRARRMQTMDSASILATLPPALRQEILLDGEADFLASLPPDIAAQEHRLEIHQQITGMLSQSSSTLDRMRKVRSDIEKYYRAIPKTPYQDEEHHKVLAWMDDTDKAVPEPRKLWGPEVAAEVMQELTNKDTHLSGLTYSSRVPSGIDPQASKQYSGAIGATIMDPVTVHPFKKTNPIVTHSQKTETKVNAATSQPISDFDMEIPQMKPIDISPKTKNGAARDQGITPKGMNFQQQTKTEHQGLDIDKDIRYLDRPANRVDTIFGDNQRAGAFQDQATDKDIHRETANSFVRWYKTIKNIPSIDDAFLHKGPTVALSKAGNEQVSIAETMPMRAGDPWDYTMKNISPCWKQTFNPNRVTIDEQVYERITSRLIFYRMKCDGFSDDFLSHLITMSGKQRKSVPIPLVELTGEKWRAPRFILNGQLCQRIDPQQTGERIPLVAAKTDSRFIREWNTHKPPQSTPIPELPIEDSEIEPFANTKEQKLSNSCCPRKWNQFNLNANPFQPTLAYKAFEKKPISKDFLAANIETKSKSQITAPDGYMASQDYIQATTGSPLSRAERNEGRAQGELDDTHARSSMYGAPRGPRFVHRVPRIRFDHDGDYIENMTPKLTRFHIRRPFNFPEELMQVEGFNARARAAAIARATDQQETSNFGQKLTDANTEVVDADKSTVQDSSITATTMEDSKTQGTTSNAMRNYPHYDKYQAKRVKELPKASENIQKVTGQQEEEKCEAKTQRNISHHVSPYHYYMKRTEERLADRPTQAPEIVPEVNAQQEVDNRNTRRQEKLNDSICSVQDYIKRSELKEFAELPTRDPEIVPEVNTQEVDNSGTPVESFAELPVNNPEVVSEVMLQQQVEASVPKFEDDWVMADDEAEEWEIL